MILGLIGGFRQILRFLQSITTGQAQLNHNMRNNLSDNIFRPNFFQKMPWSQVYYQRSQGVLGTLTRWVLSDEYPCARVLVIFQGFLHGVVMAKLATCSVRVNPYAAGG